MLTINLEWDPDAQAAPQSFRTGVQAAANVLEAAIYDPITVNIEIGYGEYDYGGPDYTPLTDYSLGGVGGGIQISYPLLRAALANDETSPTDVEAIDTLPDTTALSDETDFFISSAQAKALGAMPATSSAIDGYAGFPSSFTGNGLVAAAITELIHAMGLLTAGGVLGLFQFTAPGNYLLASEDTASTPAYFSVDGGNTNLANYDVGFDDTLFSDVNNDPLSVPNTESTVLTALDLTEISAIGFDDTSTPSLPAPDVTTASSNGAAVVNARNVTVAENVAIPVLSLIASVSAPSGDSIPEYLFYDDGGGSGHFAVGGVIEPDDQWVYALSTQLDTLQYVGGASTGQDTLFVSAYDYTAATFTQASYLFATTAVPDRTLSWTGGSSQAFGAAASWDDLTDHLNSAAAAPDATDTVEFNSLGGAVSGTGTVSAVDVGMTGAGALQIGDGTTIVTGSFDAGIGATGVGQIGLTDAGTELTVTGNATVADDGTGVMSVLSGATFSAASLTIGSQGDSSGAVVVSGQGSVVNISGDLNVGTAFGTGDLTIGPGATVNALVANLQGQVVLENGELDPTVNLINQGQTAGGSGTIAAGDIVDEGVIQAGGSKPSQKLLVVAGTVLGGGPWTINGSAQAQANGNVGALQINAGGTLELTGPVLNAASTTFTDDVTPQSTYTVSDSVVDVNFEDATGVLKIDDIGGFAGTIAAFRKGDSFVITGGTLSNLGVSNSDTLTVSDSGNGGTDQIIFGSPVSASGFAIVNNNTIQVACFAAGTRIKTETGWAAVEDLRVNDHVVTVETGECGSIVWVGQRTVNCERHPMPEAVWPVRISAGAFGRNVPVRDLYLSPDHAVFVNGVLVPVKLLINGTSIAQMKRDRVTYYHVELPRHAVILAEGLTVESYLDLGDRADFANSSETIRLFPDFAAGLAPDAALAWETRGTAPLVLAGDKLAAARGMVMPPRGFRSSAQIPRTG